VCDASIHGSRFIATTVFLFDPADRLLKGTASTGALVEVSLSLRISSDESLPEGRGTIGTAFRTGKPCVSQRHPGRRAAALLARDPCAGSAGARRRHCR
jgi:hypothetical protein